MNILTIIFVLIFFLVPLGLLLVIERAIYRRLKQAVAEEPEREIRFTTIWLIQSLLGALPSLFLFAFFASEFGSAAASIFEIFAYLAFGWAPMLFQQVSRLFQHWEVVSIAGVLMILGLIAFHVFMHWRKGFWKVRWTAGLAGVVGLVFLSGFAFVGATRHTAGVIQEPIVHKLSGRYNSDTKSNLHNVYLACKAYWADHGGDKSCNREIVTSTTYGYVQSRDVRIEATGEEKEFRGLATNINSNKWFWMDELGSIQPFTPSNKKS